MTITDPEIANGRSRNLQKAPLARAGQIRTEHARSMCFALQIFDRSSRCSAGRPPSSDMLRQFQEVIDALEADERSWSSTARCQARRRPQHDMTPLWPSDPVRGATSARTVRVRFGRWRYPWRRQRLAPGREAMPSLRRAPCPSVKSTADWGSACVDAQRFGLRL
jgi:hypothetical protein